MVGGKDQGFRGLIVGSAAWIFAPTLVAVFAAEDLFAVFGVSVFDQMLAAAVGATQGSGKHRFSLP